MRPRAKLDFIETRWRKRGPRTRAVHRASISLRIANQISKHTTAQGEHLGRHERADVLKFYDHESYGQSRQ
jgi:hypothetical protein